MKGLRDKYYRFETRSMSLMASVHLLRNQSAIQNHYSKFSQLLMAAIQQLLEYSISL
jgi:hypothetical protein